MDRSTPRSTTPPQLFSYDVIINTETEVGSSYALHIRMLRKKYLVLEFGLNSLTNSEA